MILEAGKIVICMLWLLLCLRLYTTISRDNVWQRRFIAIAAGLSAGLIYVLCTMLISVVKSSINTDTPPAEGAQEVRINSQPPPPSLPAPR